MELRAPIVAVTVHPANARITRRGTATVPVGASELVVTDLPATLLEDSVRIAGRSEQAVRLVGVDLRWRDLAEAPDARVRAAEEAVREAQRVVDGLDAADAGDAARQDLLARLASSGGDRLARALAEGSADVARIAEVGAAVAEQVTQVSASRRAHAERRARAQQAVDAATAELDRLRGSGRTRREAVLAVEADVEAELEVELGYVVGSAGWSTAYDARLRDDHLLLTWYGMVTQASGEDWPACELTLSTARPSPAATVPELDPWWVDVRRPPRPAAARAMAFAAGGSAMEAAPVPDEGEYALAASWRLPRPTAVPGDGTPHRATITTAELPVRLDHVTVPAVSLDVHLRATVTNAGAQTLPAGPVSTFVDDAFVGTTDAPQTAPGAELELALGLDDRVVVERELADRTAHKTRFGANRAAVQLWTTTVTNHRRRPVRVLVRDRVPVSRNADIKIVDVALKPEPDERDDLGRVEWVARIEPGATWESSVRFGVEHPKDVRLSGWQD